MIHLLLFFPILFSHWKFQKKKKTMLRVSSAHQEKKTKAFLTQCDNQMQTRQRFKMLSSYFSTYLQMQQQLAKIFLNYSKCSKIHLIWMNTWNRSYEWKKLVEKKIQRKLVIFLEFPAKLRFILRSFFFLLTTHDSLWI